MPPVDLGEPLDTASDTERCLGHAGVAVTLTSSPQRSIDRQTRWPAFVQTLGVGNPSVSAYPLRTRARAQEIGKRKQFSDQEARKGPERSSDARR
jgi:hypothetical protein